jgi:hypothetical protein
MPNVDSTADPLAAGAIDIESIIAEAARAGDKHTAQAAKTKIDALVNAYKLREAAGKYVPILKVEEALAKVGGSVRASIMRLEADLPPMLEGLPPSKMQKIIREKIDEVMTALSESSSEVWTNEDQE